MMNTFQFISSIGGAGAPEDNEENKGNRRLHPEKPSFPSVESALGPPCNRDWFLRLLYELLKARIIPQRVPPRV